MYVAHPLVRSEEALEDLTLSPARASLSLIPYSLFFIPYSLGFCTRYLLFSYYLILSCTLL